MQPKVEHVGPIPSVRYLKIERFRGIESLEWRPVPGLNVIVGPGDSGKSTILDAIGALLSPAPNMSLSEFDYFRRDIEKGFVIEAALAVDDAAILKTDSFPPPPLRGWLNGQLTDLPDEDGAEAVLVCRLTGTDDQEAQYEVIGADEATRVRLPRALRQHIGLMRLGITDRWDRDLRLVQGGALDRYMEGQHLRQSILQRILKTPIHEGLEQGSKEALAKIGKRFGDRGLPHPVRLGLVGTPGVSLAASVGLMIGSADESALPLPAWGTGTRRLATLELASILAERISLAVVDEPESGLEPYRQRAFIGDLHNDGKRQSFITTHSPAILSAAATHGATISRVNVQQPKPTEDGAQPEEDAIVLRHLLMPLSGKEIEGLLKSQPESVLARLPVICEGITEEGFATRLLIEEFGANFPVRGLFCVDAGGHYSALPICKALLKAGFQIAAVVDDEGIKQGSWDRINVEAAALLRWPDGASLERAVLTAFPNDVLPMVVMWPEEAGGKEARHCLADVRGVLGVADKAETAAQLLENHGRTAFLDSLCTAACPPASGDKKRRGWFKSFRGGHLLADKLLGQRPIPERVDKEIKTFLSNIRSVVGA